MTIEAVIFDWSGTLTPWHAVDVRRCWHAAAGALRPDGAWELGEALVESEARLWERSRHEHRAATFAEVFHGAGVAVTPEQVDQLLFPAFFAGWEPHTRADPQARALLAELRRRGLRVGVLSNTLWSAEVHHRLFLRDGLAEFIDAAVYSSELGWTKPHPAAFAAVLARMRVDSPRRAVHVGDRLFDDIHGARQAGLRAVHIPHSRIPREQRGAVDGVPDAVISELAQLIPLLDRWERR